MADALLAQQTYEASCGDVIEQEFTSSRESITFKIPLKGGDKVKVFAKGKYGKELKVAVAIVGPSGKVVADKKGQPTNIFEIESPVLPATGIYTVGICNYYRWNAQSRGNLGPFIIEFICDQRENSVPQPAPAPVISTPAPAPVYTAPPPPVEAGSADISSLLQNGSFLTIPLNTPIGASLAEGSGRIQAFETELKAGTQTKVKVEILEGTTPLQMEVIHRFSEKIVFSSVLRYAADMQVILDVPHDGTYVVAIREYPVQGGLKRPTKFRVTVGSTP